jgi:hypothetical protein
MLSGFIWSRLATNGTFCEHEMNLRLPYNQRCGYYVLKKKSAATGYWEACEKVAGWISSRFMLARTQQEGAIPFILASKPYVNLVSRWLAYCLATCYKLVFALLIFDSEDGGDMFLRKQRFMYGLHGAISQKSPTFKSLLFKKHLLLQYKNWKRHIWQNIHLETNHTFDSRHGVYVCANTLQYKKNLVPTSSNADLFPCA